MSQIITESISGNDSLMKVPYSNLEGDAKWKDIEDLINRWAKRNKKAAYEMEIYLNQTRAGLTDTKFATMDGDAMAGGRHMLSLHPELLQYIEAFYPKFLSTKEEMHQFMKKFPKFSIPESV